MGFQKIRHFFVYAITHKQRFLSPQLDGDLTSTISALCSFLLHRPPLCCPPPSHPVIFQLAILSYCFTTPCVNDPTGALCLLHTSGSLQIHNCVGQYHVGPVPTHHCHCLPHWTALAMF